MEYHSKYLKYKSKYLSLKFKEQSGGHELIVQKLINPEPKILEKDKKLLPDGGNFIIFNFKNDKNFGKINLLNPEKDLDKLEDKYFKAVNYDSIYVHLPFFDKWIAYRFDAKGGFSFEELINIVNRALMFHFDKEKINQKDFPDKYIITSSNFTSGIYVHKNDVYIDLKS